MSVGTSDGQHYDSGLDFAIQNIFPDQPDLQAKFLSSRAKTSSLDHSASNEQVTDPSVEQEMFHREFQDMQRPDSPGSGTPGVNVPHPSRTGLNIDNQHHVPLVASAIMGQDGQMVGMAVDHRLNLSDDDKELLALHEGTELPYMNDLVKNGMSPADAYAEAHKWATARETAASIAKWGEDGHEAYKTRMRNNAQIASQPSDQDRHPMAHTTVYGLDESEGVHDGKDNILPLFVGSFAGAGAATANKEALSLAQSMDHAKYRPDAIYRNTGWYKGSDNQWRFELPSHEATLVDTPENIPAGKTELENILKYPSLYKAYPELAKMEVNIDPDLKVYGSYNVNSKSISINPNSEMRDTLIHEIQHVIQHKEGFKQGTNPDLALNQLHDYLNNLKDRNPKLARELATEINKLAPKGGINRLDELGRALYDANPGELEARLAEVRSRLSKSGKAEYSPQEMLERASNYDPVGWPREVQIPTELGIAQDYGRSVGNAGGTNKPKLEPFE